jgi:hypothetical protein
VMCRELSACRGCTKTTACLLIGDGGAEVKAARREQNPNSGDVQSRVGGGWQRRYSGW